MQLFLQFGDGLILLLQALAGLLAVRFLPGQIPFQSPHFGLASDYALMDRGQRRCCRSGAMWPSLVSASPGG